MSQEEFSTAFLALLNKDSPKTNFAIGYRTLTDQEAENFKHHLYEWFQHQARYEISTGDLVTALLKTKRCASEQDRAEAMSRLLLG